MLKRNPVIMIIYAAAMKCHSSSLQSCCRSRLLRSTSSAEAIRSFVCFSQSRTLSSFSFDVADHFLLASVRMARFAIYLYRELMENNVYVPKIHFINFLFPSAAFAFGRFADGPYPQKVNLSAALSVIHLPNIRRM